MASVTCSCCRLEKLCPPDGSKVRILWLKGMIRPRPNSSKVKWVKVKSRQLATSSFCELIRNEYLNMNIFETKWMLWRGKIKETQVQLKLTDSWLRSTFFFTICCNKYVQSKYKCNSNTNTGATKVDRLGGFVPPQLKSRPRIPLHLPRWAHTRLLKVW